MSKKNFSGGLNSLLGEQPTKTTKKKEREASKGELEAFKVAVQNGKLDHLIKRGRPVTQTKEITKTSQVGTKENETRATFIVNEDLLEKLKAIAYWDRVLIKELINSALEETVTKYEKKQGKIKPIPVK